MALLLDAQLSEAHSQPTAVFGNPALGALLADAQSGAGAERFQCQAVECWGFGF